MSRFSPTVPWGADRGDHIDLAINEVRDQRGELIVSTLCQAVFDRYILVLNIPGFAQSLTERSDKTRQRDARAIGEKADHRHRLLLRAECARGGHRATQQQHQLPTLHHSMTSSASARIDGGTVRPSALAVLRLTTSSNRVGCWTGRSAGLAPLRILPV